MKDKKRIAVFASGYGSNLQAIIDYSQKKDISGSIVLVLSNNADSYALKRAEKNSIRSVCIEPGGFKDRAAFDAEILMVLSKEKIDLIVLAGYMLLLGEEIVGNYQNRILNIHPALLPAFKGLHGIKDAYDYGVRVTGVTVHFVDNGLDSGPIIFQQAVILDQDDSLEMIGKKIHEVEHKVYPEAIRLFCQDRLQIRGRKVLIK